MHDSLFISLIVIAIFAIIGFIFRKQIGRRLALRVAALIIGTIMVVALATVVLSDTLFNNTPAPGGPIFGLLLFILIPLFIGYLTSRFVNRPLRQFTRAIKSLESNKTHQKIASSGIREFDQVTSEFNRLVMRLQKEEELRKDLISDTSHELNTPLTTIIGQLTAMQDGTLPITKKRVGVLKEQAERLIELTEQLNAYTLARTPSPDRSRSINVRETFQKLVDELSVDLKANDIQVLLKVDKGLYIDADPNAFQQITHNLITNSIRYAEATKITFTANDSGITYSDNGKGVPAKSLPYLFERFYRVDSSRSRETGGLGLGLAIVKELALQQGWMIHAESAQPGLAIVVKFH